MQVSASVNLRSSAVCRTINTSAAQSPCYLECPLVEAEPGSIRNTAISCPKISSMQEHTNWKTSTIHESKLSIDENVGIIKLLLLTFLDCANTDISLCPPRPANQYQLTILAIVLPTLTFLREPSWLLSILPVLPLASLFLLQLLLQLLSLVEVTVLYVKRQSLSC